MIERGCKLPMSSETGQLRPASQTLAPHKEASVIDPNFSPLLSHPHRRMPCVHIREEREKKEGKTFQHPSGSALLTFIFYSFSLSLFDCPFNSSMEDKTLNKQLGALFVVIPSVCVLSDQRSSGLTLSDDKGGGQREDDNESSKHWKRKVEKKRWNIDPCYDHSRVQKQTKADRGQCEGDKRINLKCHHFRLGTLWKWLSY